MWNNLKGSFDLKVLPAYVFNAEPLVLYTVWDVFSYKKNKFSQVLNGVECELLIQIGASYNDYHTLERICFDLYEFLNIHKNIKVRILCNLEEETMFFLDRGLNTELVNVNCFYNEMFYPLVKMDKYYSLTYTPTSLEMTWHDLFLDDNRITVIYDHDLFSTTEVLRIKRSLKQTSFLDTSTKVSKFAGMSRSRIGLCPELHSMRSRAIEYLLLGVPVIVNEEQKNFLPFYDVDFCSLVPHSGKDLENSIEMILADQVDHSQLRSHVLEKMKFYRHNLSEVLAKSIGQENEFLFIDEDVKEISNFLDCISHYLNVVQNVNRNTRF